MKTLFKTIVSIAILAALVVPSTAQDSGPKGGQRPGGQVGAGGKGDRGPGMRMGGMRKVEEKVLGQLGLNAGQKQKIEALNKKFEADVKKLMDEMQKQGKNADRKAMGEKVRKLMEGRRDGLFKILTPAQKSKYEQLMKAEMEKMRKEREKNRPGGAAKPGTGGKKPA